MSIIGQSLSPLRTYIGPCPSMFNKCFERKVLLVANLIADAVTPSVQDASSMTKDLTCSNTYLNLPPLVIMQTKMNYCLSQIVLLVHDVIHASWTQLHTKGGNITTYAKRWTKCKTICLKLVNNITIPNYFVFTFVKKKEITSIILALHMTQAMSSLKFQVEIVLDVSHFNPVPHMAIMFPIHSLDLTRMIIGTNKRE